GPTNDPAALTAGTDCTLGELLGDGRLAEPSPPEQADSPKALAATKATTIPLRVNPLNMLLVPIIDPPSWNATNSPWQSTVSRSWRAVALT
ncbi:MAG TPA: hypothetical protein VNF75_06065, partial [Candidatus Dormibacteraeota bacterium]|nr:hypothetical protein [Candidatus Dormibacteraeota bacterium]